MENKTHYVFGYGSLVNVDLLEQFLNRKINPCDWKLCNLNGFRRIWNIAMDNYLNLSGYKYYIDSKTGRRLKIYVVFLNIYQVKQELVNGIIFKVTSSELKKIDKRERNYERININKFLDLNLTQPCWTYIGLKEAEIRYKRGLELNTAFININYYNNVINAFSSHGIGFLYRFKRSTANFEVPFINLRPITIED